MGQRHLIHELKKELEFSKILETSLQFLNNTRLARVILNIKKN